MIYDATAHQLLSPEALLLGSGPLGQFNDLAEDLLSLGGTAYADADGAKATRAVALQINHLVALGPDAFVFSAVSRGGRSWSYRGGDSGPLLVNPAAAKLVSSLPVSGDNTGYTALTSRRRSAV